VWSTVFVVPWPLISFSKAGFVGQTNTGSERLLENGSFDESVQRLGSADFLVGGGCVHDLNS
jgi:hypothetical protein